MFMPAMNKQQIDDFLRESQVSRIATIADDGAPYVVPVVYEWDGQHMFIVARKRAAWVKHLRREPRVSVLVDEAPIPQRKVMIQGVAEIVGTDWIAIARRIVGKYLGSAVSDKYLGGTRDQPRWVIKVTPTNITTWHNPPQYADSKEAWHPRYYEPGTKWYEEYQKERKKS